MAFPIFVNLVQVCSVGHANFKLYVSELVNLRAELVANSDWCY